MATSLIPSPPRTNLAARMCASDPELDPKTVNAVFNSLRDRIYQRSFNLRKTFRELDANSAVGPNRMEKFAESITRAFSLNALESKCLRVLLDDADFKRDGHIDFQEFCGMLKLRDYEGDGQMSRAQAQRLGVKDPRIQKMLKEDGQTIPLRGGVPTNELGHMNIECPYGVLGDSERMDAVIAAFFTHKTDQLRVAFTKHDADRDGWLTRTEFRNAMKEVDKYVFDDEINALLESLLEGHDHKRNKFHRTTGKAGHLVEIDSFLSGAGREYLKKKAHRSHAHANPLVWPQPPAELQKTAWTPRGTGSGGYGNPTDIANHRATSARRSWRKVQDTRASELRTQDVRSRLVEQTSKRREDALYQMVLDERRGKANDTAAARLPAIQPTRRLQPVSTSGL